jgi:hypothetical protein
MKRSGFFLFCLLLAAPLHAQLYKWVDANGKVQYSDKPPPAGAKGEAVKNRSSSVSGSAASAGTTAPDAAKADPKAAAKSSRPLTAAEQEQAFRKRKLEEEEAQKKSQDKTAQDTQRQENCTTVKNQVITLEAGGRQQRLDAKGERYFLDEQQIQAELTKARQQVATLCN